MEKTYKVPDGSGCNMTDRMKFENRNEFPAFLNECGLVGTGAEIGVLEGAFSEHVLRTWKRINAFLH